MIRGPRRMAPPEPGIMGTPNQGRLPRKLALGLFHFNIQYVAGGLSGYHRYCTQAIIPFLEVFQANPTFRASFELAGVGLEFLAKHYPWAIAALRDLNRRGQLEIISSTYTPALWVAFPGRDLRKSVELNRSRIASLGLEVAEIFFAQEAFFGSGLRALDELFAVALCKDEFLRHQMAPGDIAAAYRLGRMRVVVGASHMLNEVAAIARADPASSIARASLGIYGERIRQAMLTLPESGGGAKVGAAGDIAWRWYHMGSGHHFVTPHSPENWSQFFADERWMAINMSVLQEIEAAGFTLSTVSDFVSATKDIAVKPLPPVVEGGWNTVKSRGVFTWMNRQSRSWDRNTEILGMAWRSREEVVKCEEIVEVLPTDAQELARSALEAVWQDQLMAESSDPCGWVPVPSEVRFGMEAADAALLAAQAFRERLETQYGPIASPAGAGEDIDADGADSTAIQELVAAMPTKLVAAQGCAEIYAYTAQAVCCAMSARAVAAEAGISFPVLSGRILFCPSGLEWETQPFEVDEMRADETFFPLANGLLGVGNDCFIIRINRYGQPAARVARASREVSFLICGSVVGRPLDWRFLLFKGPVAGAIALANKVNCV